MLPQVGFRDEEWSSGVVSRPAPNYRRELAEWFGGKAAEAPALKAVGTTDGRPARIPFLIF